MEAASNLGMIASGKYVFFYLHITASFDSEFTWQTHNTSEQTRLNSLHAYSALKIVALRSPPPHMFKHFAENVRKLAEQEWNYSAIAGKPYTVWQLSHLPSSVILNLRMTVCVLDQQLRDGVLRCNPSVRDGGERNNGTGDECQKWDRSYEAHVESYFRRLIHEVAYSVGSKGKLFNIGKWHWIGGVPPPDEPICGYDNSLCPTKEMPPWMLALIFLSATSTIFGVMSFFIFRHFKMEAELNAMTWLICWSEICGEDKGVQHRKRRDSHFTWLRDQKLLRNASSQSLQSVGYAWRIILQAKDLQFDHITRFVGACIEYPHYCVVTEYCPKGSLQDILENSGIQLDKMMIFSLVHDIVKGMCFIHSSDIRVHGKLKSTNCLVDSRFVLKITDFGLVYLHALEDKVYNDDSDDCWKRKLWTAPELLREDSPPGTGTQKGDVYSFGIILHEMFFRRGVFFVDDDSISPKEIVELVMLRQQPSYRPMLLDCNISETALNLMIRCWSENPQDRPDFGTIRKNLRMLTKDYVSNNIVDNLLKRMEQYANNLESLVQERTADYLQEKQKAENLLYQLLPQSVALQLIQGEAVTAEAFDSVTIYFSDIVGFTAICSDSTPMQVVNLLNDLYTCFDSIIGNFDVYKVRVAETAYLNPPGKGQHCTTLHSQTA
ncbi:unnamed protein product [Soboliphyme baturini]|uniref:guanylate cyclase n=1 Tax=Soboliphyme baturini TaxID=241478 RepID=A0A183IFJ9_9BILA|nr:unnamed protein product [Soboliphyme baturini]